MTSENISMVQECADKYRVIENADGTCDILIHVPARFKDLWLVKLTDLMTTAEEISEYEHQTGGD